MGLEIFNLVGNSPRTGCVALFKAWKKCSLNTWVFFIIDAMVILPLVQISHEKRYFW
jgi:hypothetical protein